LFCLLLYPIMQLQRLLLLKVFSPDFHVYDSCPPTQTFTYEHVLTLCVCVCVCVSCIVPTGKHVEVKSLSRVRLCNPMDCSLPGSSIHWIFQARILEWVAISFSRGSDPGIEPGSPVLQAGSLTSEPPGKSMS